MKISYDWSSILWSVVIRNLVVYSLHNSENKYAWRNVDKSKTERLNLFLQVKCFCVAKMCLHLCVFRCTGIHCTLCTGVNESPTGVSVQYYVFKENVYE